MLRACTVFLTKKKMLTNLTYMLTCANSTAPTRWHGFPCSTACTTPRARGNHKMQAVVYLTLWVLCWSITIACAPPCLHHHLYSEADMTNCYTCGITRAEVTIWPKLIACLGANAFWTASMDSVLVQKWLLILLVSASNFYWQNVFLFSDWCLLALAVHCTAEIIMVVLRCHRASDISENKTT